MDRRDGDNRVSEEQATLPDHFRTVAEDLVGFCSPGSGRVWVDLGTGQGGLGLALLEKLDNITMMLMDPDAAALRHALDAARQRGVESRAVAVIGLAESIPLPDASADVVVSRGSFFFWQDRAKGLREVWRVLRPGGRAVIGGGLGSGYPDWARREFIRRQRESQRRKGPEAMRAFHAARSPDTFHRIAVEAGLPTFEVVGEGGLDADDPNTGVGIWLRFAKEVPNVG